VYKKNNIEFEDENSSSRAIVIAELVADSSLITNAIQKYTKDIHSIVIKLWADTVVKEAFKAAKKEFHLFDGAEYFLAQLERIDPEKYNITNEDILNCRRKTVGIVECPFTMHGRKFKLFDVGGQRNERKKWIHCFSDVNCVLFVASLADYDLTCYEDDITNRMNESLDLFEEIVNGNWFKTTPIILFLNKEDIFKFKIEKIDLKVCFGDYDGGLNYEVAIKFIEKKFLSLNRFEESRIKIIHTCAVSSKDVEKIFEKVAQIMIENFSKTETL